jgi:putative transposase
MNGIDRGDAHRLWVHMVWATRGRERILPPPVDDWLALFLGEKCAELGCRALAVGAAWDHVHVIVAFPAALPVASIAHRLKGASSRALSSRVCPFAWQAGYFAETVSDVVALVDLLRDHRVHHADAGLPEAWEEAFVAGA